VSAKTKRLYTYYIIILLPYYDTADSIIYVQCKQQGMIIEKLKPLSKI
jgi:hypothetical protein